jgi:hypothetical protein
VVSETSPGLTVVTVAGVFDGAGMSLLTGIPLPVVRACAPAVAVAANRAPMPSRTNERFMIYLRCVCVWYDALWEAIHLPTASFRGEFLPWSAGCL